jgi:hypothetical protein
LVNTLLMKIQFLILLMLGLFFSACKKDQLNVDVEKTYVDKSHKGSGTFYDNPFTLKLSPGHIADILPSGDIMNRGSYKINGDKIKVKSEIGNFEFKIISPTELKDLTYGKTLSLISN